MTGRDSKPEWRAWRVGCELWRPDVLPRLMGIINTTPDSFSDGGRFETISAAAERAIELERGGAQILDVGGESTRPGAAEVSASDELRRVLPAIRAIRQVSSLPISIDTTKAEVAAAALGEGAVIVNDISGLTFDPQMVDVCRDHQSAVVCMHIQGRPRTMQENPTYGNVVTEVTDWLGQRISELVDRGLDSDRIAIDPGIGFGKTAEHNLQLLASVKRLQSLGRPVLIGHSRKRFLKKLTDRDVEQREFGTVGVSVALAAQGVDLIRVHDPAASRDAMVAFQTIQSAQPPLDPD